MGNKKQYNVIITCNKQTTKFFEKLVEQLKQLSDMGSSSVVTIEWSDEEKKIEFDGDGIHTISILEIERGKFTDSIFKQCPSCGDVYDPEIGMEDRCYLGICSQ
jgi:hypothetical protein